MRDSVRVGSVFCTRASTRLAAGIHLLARDLQLQGAFDRTQFPNLGAGNQGRCAAGRAHASGAAHAMNEVLRNLRQIIVYDMRNIGNVNTARGHVGGHQDLEFP